MDGDRAEHVREGIPVLASYCDAFGIRAFAEGTDLAFDLAETQFNAMAATVNKPLINLESAVNHPCQALADWKTMDELGVPQRGKFVLSWVKHPRPLPLAVPAATLHMAAMRGMDVTVLRPDGFALPDAIMEKARRAAAASGGSVSETTDRAAAMKGATVLYAKEWGSTRFYGDVEGDSTLRSQLGDWQVDERWFANADQDCRFMHCLPVRRNVAVADHVLDGPRSVVLHEAHNRMPAQMAGLHRLRRQIKALGREAHAAPDGHECGVRALRGCRAPRQRLQARPEGLQAVEERPHHNCAIHGHLHIPGVAQQVLLHSRVRLLEHVAVLGVA
jgi:N-acetylornithine carbamoyltransferase